MANNTNNGNSNNNSLHLTNISNTTSSNASQSTAKSKKRILTLAQYEKQQKEKLEERIHLKKRSHLKRLIDIEYDHILNMLDLKNSQERKHANFRNQLEYARLAALFDLEISEREKIAHQISLLEKKIEREKNVDRKKKLTELLNYQKKEETKISKYIADLKQKQLEKNVNNGNKNSSLEELREQLQLLQEEKDLLRERRRTLDDELKAKNEKLTSNKTTIEDNKKEKRSVSKQIKEKEKSLKGSSLSPEEKEKIQKELDILKIKKDQLTTEGKNLTKEGKQIDKEIKALEDEDTTLTNAEDTNYELLKETQGKAQKQALTEAAFNSINNAFGKQAQDNMLAKFNDYIEEIAAYQSKIDTRLLGSDETWDSVSSEIVNKVGTVPFVKTKEIMDNIDTLVDQGVAYNVEQRAFLNTVADKIATTFDAFDASLLRIIRLQNQDSTAARLGMEAELNEFFNSEFKDTTYLTDMSQSITGALTESLALMNTKEGVEYEFQVQKWLGSLYSSGFSQDAVNNLAAAIDALGSGDLEKLQSNENIFNLVAMAAARIGNPLATILKDGLDASTTNDLLGSMVEYLQEIATNGNNKVVLAEYAKTFGMQVSDLTAAINVYDDMSTIKEQTLTYASAMDKLESTMKTVYQRVPVGEMLNNAFENFFYGTSESIANNPVMNAMWKVTTMINELTGGIAIPAFDIKVMGTGTGIDLNTTVENLIRTGLIGIGTLGNIGGIISGIGNTFAFNNVIGKLGLNEETFQDDSGNYSWDKYLETAKQTQELRGGRQLARKQKQQGPVTSDSSYVATTSGEDYGDSALNKSQDDAEKSGNEKLEAKKEENKEASITDLLDWLKTENGVNNVSKNVVGIKDSISSMVGLLSASNSNTTTQTQLNNIISLLGGLPVEFPKQEGNSNTENIFNSPLDNLKNEVKDIVNNTNNNSSSEENSTNASSTIVPDANSGHLITITTQLDTIISKISSLNEVMAPVHVASTSSISNKMNSNVENNSTSTSNTAAATTPGETAVKVSSPYTQVITDYNKNISENTTTIKNLLEKVITQEGYIKTSEQLSSSGMSDIWEGTHTV